MSRRVLIVTNMYPEAGRPAWGVFIKSQVDSLAALGVELDVMVIRGYRSRLEYLKAIPALWRRCAARRYDLIHAHYGLSGLVARSQRRLPVLVSYCGNDLLGHADEQGRVRLRGLPLRWLQRRLAHHVDRVIVKSGQMASVIPGVRAHVIPNGVDLARFRPLERARCRAALGLDPDAVYVLFPSDPGRARKNYPLARETLAALSRRHAVHASPLVVHGVPNERMPLYLNAVDAMILTSFWEGSPNVLKEAMACNTRIVSVDVGDVKELLDGHPGAAVRGYDPVALADALHAVLGSAAPVALRDAVRRLAAPAVARRILALYEAVSPRATPR